MTPSNPDANCQVVISREFGAPRALVFKAWTSVDNLTQWFAPRVCQVSYRQFDFREGGDFHSCIRTPDGYECWCKGVYRTIVEPELIEFTMETTNERREIVQPSDVGMDPEWPRVTVVTVTFEEEEGRTLVTLRQTVDESLAKRTGAYPSWLEMFDRLDELLKLQ